MESYDVGVWRALSRLDAGWVSGSAAERVQLLASLRAAIRVAHSTFAATVVRVSSQLLAPWTGPETRNRHASSSAGFGENSCPLSKLPRFSEELVVEICALVSDACGIDFDKAVCDMSSTGVADTVTQKGHHSQRSISNVDPSVSSLASLFLSDGDANTLPDDDDDDLSFNEDPGGFTDSETANLDADLSSRASRIARRAFQAENIALEGAAAHVLQALRDIVEIERAIKIRRAALLSIRSMFLVIHPDFGSAILPGMMSCLSRLLTNCRLEHSAVCASALDAMRVALLRILPAPKQPADGAFSVASAKSLQSVIAELREKASTQTSGDTEPLASVSSVSRLENPRSSRKALRVDRTPSWLSDATSNVSQHLGVMLMSKDGPCHHAGPFARRMLAIFSGSILSQQVELAGDTLNIVLSTLVTLRSDDNHVVAVAAKHELSDAICRKTVTFRQLQSGVTNSVHRALHFTDYSSQEVLYGEDDTVGSREIHPRVLRDSRKIGTPGDPDHEQSWLPQLHGYMETLYSNSEALGFGSLASGPPASSHRGGQNSEDCASAIMDAIAPIDPFDMASVLVRAFEVAAHPASTSIVLASAASSENRAHSLCHILGRGGTLSALHVPLLQIASLPASESVDSTSFANSLYVPEVGPANIPVRGRALAALDALIVSTLRSQDVTAKNSSSASDVDADRIDGAKLCALELLRALSDLRLAGDGDMQDDGIFVDDNSLRVKLECLESMGNVFRALNAFGGNMEMDYLLTVIVGLLRDCAVSDPSISSAAVKILNIIVQVYGYADQRDLMEHHLNFILSRVIRNLHQAWAGSVLRVIVGSRMDNVSRRAISMIEISLVGESNDLASASDSRTLASLCAIQSALEAAQKLKNDKTQKRVHARQISHSQDDASELRKCIMLFCVDDTDEDDDVDANRLSDCPGNDEQNTMDELKNNTEAEETTKKGPFTRLASSALAGCCDLLVGRPLAVRTAALRCCAVAVRILANYESELLPHVAKLLPLLPDQFSGRKIGSSLTLQQRVRMRRGVKPDHARAFLVIETVNAMTGSLHVIAGAAELLSVLVQAAGSFVRERFVRLIYPRLDLFLELGKLQTMIKPSSLGGSSADQLPLPSHAASRAVDAVMEAVATVSLEVPAALQTFIPGLVQNMQPYLPSEELRERRQPISIGSGNQARDRFERERNLKRRKWATDIVSSLVTASPDESWFAVVQNDQGCRTLPKPHPDLYDIII
jgi:hypothetical protein